MQHKRLTVLTTTVAVLALLTAACGGGSASESTTTAAPAATTTTMAAPESTTTTVAETSTTMAPEWQSGDAWDAGAPAEWADILKAGQDEGVVVVGGFPYLEDSMKEAFLRDTGIQLEWVGGGGGEISSRFEQEARSGNMTLDIILGGGTELETLYPDGLLSNVADQMILPGTADGDWWRLGKKQWYDDAQAYFFEGAGWVFGYITVNADLVDPASITTLDDLLRPEFKGKIIANDPTAQGAGQGAAAAMVGAGVSIDYLKQLFIDQQVDLTQDNGQVVEALARGTHSVALFALQSQIEKYKAQGFNLQVVTPSDYPGYVTSGFSVLKQAVAAPHPNAAQVFINWYASQPGQQTYQDVLLAASNRLDTDRSSLPAYVIPQDGVTYFEDSSETFRLTQRRAAVDELVALFGGR